MLGDFPLNPCPISSSAQRPTTIRVSHSGGVVNASCTETCSCGTTGLQAVNPVTKAVLPFQQMFTVLADVTAAAATLTITPPIIPVSGDAAFGTTDIAAGAGATLQIVGDASGSYRQNLVFQNAFALCVVPMERPADAVDVARKSYKGISVRVVPYYDGTNEVSNYRLDILYGVKMLDGRLA